MDILEIKEAVKQSVGLAIVFCGTQEKLARKAGITQGAVGKYVRKEALPTGVTAKKLSFAVDGTQSPADFAPHIF